MCKNWSIIRLSSLIYQYTNNLEQSINRGSSMFYKGCSINLKQAYLSISQNMVFPLSPEDLLS